MPELELLIDHDPGNHFKNEIARKQFGRNCNFPALRLVRFQNGQTLAARRASWGWTQKQLAEKAGVSIQTVRYWENQRDREEEGGCSSSACQKMADVLEMEPYWFDMTPGAYRKSTDDVMRWLGMDFLLSDRAKQGPASKN